MRYLIDQRDAEPETALALYRAALNWAAGRGDRFAINVRPDAYEDREEVSRLLALGEVTQDFSDAPRGLVGRMVEKLFHSGSDMSRVEGKPGPEFADAMTRAAAPAGAVSGDLSPVEDVLILAGGRALFASYDYGRDLLLDLNDEETESLRRALRESGLDDGRVTPAPPSMRGA